MNRSSKWTAAVLLIVAPVLVTLAVTRWAIWHADSSLATKLALVKVVHIAPILLMVVVFVWSLRPRTAVMQPLRRWRRPS